MSELRYPICPDCQENLTSLDNLHVCPGCGLKFSVEPTTAITEKRFATKAQANAFVEGVEYVNDSALEVLQPLSGSKMLRNFTNLATDIVDLQPTLWNLS